MQINKLVAALLCAVSPIVQAATDETSNEIMVVTPRIEQPLSQSMASTTIISAEDIRNSQAPDVPTILRDVAGVEESQTGGIGKPASLFLRGTNANQVLVLVDGVRVDDATTGTTSIDQLMIDQIDHIEVARGNLSSLYGSEAIGGVVQIFTKKGHGAPAANVSAGIGSQGTRKLATGFGGSSDATDFNLQLSTFRTDGVQAINPAIAPTVNPATDGYRNNSLSANVGHSFNADHRISGSIFGSDGNNRYDNTFNLLPTDVNTNRDQIWKYSVASDDQMSDSWHSKVQLANGVDQYRDFLNGMPTPGGSLYQTSSNQLTWQNSLKLDDSKQLLLGAEALRQKVSSDISPGYVQNTRQINSLFAGYTGRYDAHQLQVNVRQDNYSQQYGGETTGLLGYGYSLSDTWRVTTSYSTAFRAPTFNELYYPNTGFGGGNPMLRPERARDFEAGLRYYATGGQQFDLVYFDNRIRDMIVYNATFVPVNVNQARINGAELSYAAQFSDTGVKAALTAQNPRDAATGQILQRRAKFFSSLGATRQVGPWTVGAEWQYSGVRQDSYTDPTTFATSQKTLSAYNVFNLTAGYAFNKQTRMSLRLDNLTNQNDSNAYSYNPQGRRWFVAINYQP